MDFQKYNIKEKKQKEKGRKKKKESKNKQTTTKKKTKPQELLKIIIREIEYLKIYES